MTDSEPGIATPSDNEQQDLATAESLLRDLQAILSKAEGLVGEIDTYHGLFAELKAKLDDPTSGAAIALSTAQNIKADIDVIKQTAEKSQSDISSIVSAIKVKAAELESEYQTFVASKARVDDPASGLIATLTSGQNTLNEIKSLKTTAEQHLSSIQTISTDIQAKSKDISAAFVGFQATKAKIDDPSSGLEAVLEASTALQQQIAAVKKQSDELFAEIKKFRDESQGYTKDIADFHAKAQSHLKEVSEMETESKNLKDRIIQSYSVITGTGLGNSFDQRKKELEKSVKTWQWLALCSFVLLAVTLLVIYIVGLVEGVTIGTSMFWYRLTFASPLVFLIAFAVERYSAERGFLEKYAFKSATAFALESYTTLLKNTFKEPCYEERILEFVLSSMTTIYKEPYEHKRDSRWSFGAKNGLGEIKAELAETRESYESLQRTIRDTLPSLSSADKVSESSSSAKA